MLTVLLKKQWLEMTAFLRRSSATGKARTGWKAAGFLVLAVCVVLLVMGSVGLLAGLLCQPLSEAGLDWLYFAIMAVPALLVGVMGGGFAAYGTLYCARDNEQLLALPIPPGLILGVRMGSVWLLGTGYLAVILLPAYVVYFVLGAHPAGAALAMLPVTALLGCLSLAGSCLVGWLAAAAGSRVTRYKAVLSLVYAVLILVFAFGANFLVRSGLIWLLTHLDEASAGLRADAQAVYLLGRASLGDLPALGILAAVSLGAAAAVWLVLRRSYLRIMTTRRGAARAVYKEKPLRVHSPRAALLGRELRRLAGCTSYMVNGMLGTILLVAAAVGGIWKADLLRTGLLLLPGLASLGPALVCVSVCSVAAMNLLTPPSVSLEGGTLWLIRSLPVSAWQILRAKLDLHLALTLPPAALAAVCLLWAVGSGPADALLTPPSVSLEGGTLWLIRSLPVSAWQILRAKLDLHLALTLPPAALAAVCLLWAVGSGPADALLALAAVCLYTLLTGALGLALGVRLPNLHWTNETAAVKQGAAPVLALFANWAVLALLAGLWWVIRVPLGALGGMAVCCAVLAAGCAGVLAWLRRGGARLLERL